MNINPKIKLTLAEIAEQSVKYANTKDARKRYHRKLLKLFKESLSEDEQLYVFNNILEEITYKNIMVDPDNLLTLANIKLRTILGIFVMVILTMAVGSYLFGTNEQVTLIGNSIGKLLKILGAPTWVGN